MSTIKILDYDVEFPYSHPYDIQKSYMEKVIHCLHNKVHGVLESPTGTGKTLCLLAPVSAWVKRQRLTTTQDAVHDLFSESQTPPNSSGSTGKETKWGNKTKSIVWYTSRTHSQIAQSIAEVRRCDIRGLNIRVLGARDQLCIHPDVMNEKESYIKTIKCKELTQAKNCKYHRKLNQERDPNKYYQRGEVMDIEDLVQLGKTCGVCPYYLSKTAIEMADIVFLPYNYIIDKDSRDSNSLQFQGDVVIFDEGHNVPNTCEESYEFSFTSLDLALGIKNVKDVRTLLMVSLARLGEIADEEEVPEIAKHAENSMFVIEVLQKLESGLELLDISEELLPVSSLYDYLEGAGITARTANQLQRIVEDFNSDSSKLSIPGTTLTTFHLLEKMATTVFGSAVRSFDEETINRSFKCGVRLDPDRVNKCKRVSLYCFNPSFGIRAILQLGVQCVIITSGTLSPLRTFIHELNIPKPVTLQNGHIAGKRQVPFLILGTGVNNVRMDAAFTNRNDPQYIFSLGMTLTNLIASVPDGVLLLFSSYSMMQSLREAWETEMGVWKRLNSLKRVFVEARRKDDFINCMENYKRAIDAGNGAILMGVLRGKISEGMDFKDQYCRAVFIVGVPFPPTKDPRVKGKEKYSESLTFFNPATNSEQKLYHNSFMSVEAMKATNQAIGRVIRHGADYGAIVLVDYRFSWLRLFQNISGWLRGSTPSEKNFPQAKKILSEFFRDVHLGKLGVPEVRRQRVDGNGCPVASYISYEEYDHVKAARAPVPWISADGESAGGTSGRKTAKGKGSVRVDDYFEDISSLYASQFEKGSQEVKKSLVDADAERKDGASGLKTAKGSAIEYIDDESEDISVPNDTGIFEKRLREVKKSNSVFDALQTTRSLCPNYGEVRKFGTKEAEPETNKRKLEDFTEASQSSKVSCLEGSSMPNSQSSAKKLGRIKVKPFVKTDVREPECIDLVDEGGGGECKEVLRKPQKNHSLGKENDEAELKAKLVDYFRTVKKTLSEGDDKEFKNHSFQYMKGEKKLCDVIKLLDRIFVNPGQRTLFSGFGICVKSKDKDEWRKACRTRNIDDCLPG